MDDLCRRLSRVDAAAAQQRTSKEVAVGEAPVNACHRRVTSAEHRFEFAGRTPMETEMEDWSAAILKFRSRHLAIGFETVCADHLPRSNYCKIPLACRRSPVYAIKCGDPFQKTGCSPSELVVRKAREIHRQWSPVVNGKWVGVPEPDRNIAFRCDGWCILNFIPRTVVMRGGRCYAELSHKVWFEGDEAPDSIPLPPEEGDYSNNNDASRRPTCWRNEPYPVVLDSKAVFYRVHVLFQPPLSSLERSAFVDANLNEFIDLGAPQELALKCSVVRLHLYLAGFMAGNHMDVKVKTVANAPMAAESSRLNDVIIQSSDVMLLAVAGFLSYRQTGHIIGGRQTEGCQGHMANVIKEIRFNRPAGMSEKTFGTIVHAMIGCAQLHVIASVTNPEDLNNWAMMDPSYGVAADPDSLPSTVRTLARNKPVGVAGTSVVVHAHEALKLAVQTRMHLFLRGLQEADQLIDAYQKVLKHGLCIGVAASDWVEGNPFGLRAVQFNQASDGGQWLCTELAMYALAYRPSETLARSPALRKQYNVHEEFDDGRYEMWKTLRRVGDGGCRLLVTKHAAKDKDVASLNAQMNLLAAKLGISPPPPFSSSASQ